MNDKEKEMAIQTVKKVLHVMHSKEYKKLPECVDEMEWSDTEEIEEAVQGTLEMNGFDTIDEYGVPCNFHPDYEYHQMNFYEFNNGSGFSIDYDMTSDSELTDLVLILKFFYTDNGSKRVLLSIDPQ